MYWLRVQKDLFSCKDVKELLFGNLLAGKLSADIYPGCLQMINGTDLVFTCTLYLINVAPGCKVLNYLLLVWKLPLINQLQPFRRWKRSSVARNPAAIYHRSSQPETPNREPETGLFSSQQFPLDLFQLHYIPGFAFCRGHIHHFQDAGAIQGVFHRWLQLTNHKGGTLLIKGLLYL